MKSTLIILTKNEIVGIKRLYDKLPLNAVDEVIAIDAGSTDGTLDFFKEKGIRAIVQEKKGRGEAFRIAAKNASGDYIIFFSPDGNEDPDDIEKMIKIAGGGYHIVIGSRFMKGARSDDADKRIRYRSFGNWFFTKVVNILWRNDLTDAINGFRLVRKDALSAMNLDAQNFGIEYQMSIRALKLKYRIKEIPTYEGDRISGKSNLRSIDTGLLFIRITLEELLNGTNWKR
jgi:glycosyltransferase involved in cell wall biosynthesis